MNHRLAYALFGVAFGFCFPVFSISLDILVFKVLPLSLHSIGHVHTINQLHYVIDTAPFFLGLAFWVAGLKQDRLVDYHHRLQASQAQGMEAMRENERLVKKQNVQLDLAVRQKTSELLEANEELNQLIEELNSTLELVNAQKAELADKNRNIVASINYANRIQQAVLPPDSFFNDHFASHFILYLPRDIVSGDFYWAGTVGNRTVVAAVDCTGHGIPAAFMSLIGASLLNQIVINKGVDQPAEILAQLNDGLCATLSHNGRLQVPDGMELTICVLEKQPGGGYWLNYAGAKSNMLVLAGGEHTLLRANRKAIGEKLSQTFVQHGLEVPARSFLYLFSDGFQDQLGADTGKRFFSKNFHQLLAANHRAPAEAQKELLQAVFDDWRGPVRQLDDVLVMGLQLK
jgi:serine phosphatase RsbU (regulator of sigma subunit)